MGAQAEDTPPAGEPSGSGEPAKKPRKHCFRSLLYGMLATAALLAITQALEHLGYAQFFETLAYKCLTWSMSPFTGRPLPVVVVDIHELPGGKDGPTPRAELRALLDTMLTDAHPRAIAVDIDFSPDTKGWMTPDDPGFFNFCLDKIDLKDIPILLAVYRSRHAAPKPALGLPEYQTLAAVGIGRRDDPTRATRWVVSQHSATRLATLGEALAQANKGYARGFTGESLLLEPVARTDNILVNFSKLAEIKTQKISWRRGTSIASASASLDDRLVILGDAEQATDTFPIPTESDVVPGVFVIASTAYTLVSEPLFEFKPIVRVLLDGVISILLIGGLCYLCCTQEKETAKRRAFWFITLVIAAVLLLGVLLVRAFSIMWLDFTLVVLALFLHPSVEEKVSEWAHSQFEKRDVNSSP
jgi:CHASE2 domain-containing sensor protein